ncbi:hypothetical protein BO78DRAFT_435801 [Aspergillus sclerotiicarbonarius CBS 121057]|uniref:BTB domain-containing protein n=1 Tax=Aspergillus sclerotiicarbonarius (strain CBS 121057 / IBT 28362) TaxID=1448318 RepID=A0A319E4Q1_ASPSB|nr:hypothetical protein BO78DRAFT_435801 [Aspergillus sclerotiicarbonarius CBS 121057]
MSSNSLLPYPLCNLRTSEKYSDLTIECDGEKFETPSHSTIKVQRFGIPTVKRMIDFLYTGEYDVIKQVKPEHDDTNAGPSSTAEALLPHVFVNAIADEYEIVELAKLTNIKIKQFLQLLWCREGFEEIVKTVYEVTGDTVLRRTMAAAICEHLDDFCKPEVLKALFPDELARHVIQAMKSKYEWLQPQLVVMQQSLVSSDSKVAEMKAAKDALQKQMKTMTASVEQGHKLLHDTTRCRQCGMLFLGILETNTANGSGYILRCKDCRTKHF